MLQIQNQCPMWQVWRRVLRWSDHQIDHQMQMWWLQMLVCSHQTIHHHPTNIDPFSTWDHLVCTISFLFSFFFLRAFLKQWKIKVTPHESAWFWSPALPLLLIFFGLFPPPLSIFLIVHLPCFLFPSLPCLRSAKSTPPPLLIFCLGAPPPLPIFLWTPLPPHLIKNCRLRGGGGHFFKQNSP